MEKETVILVHGMGRTTASMLILKKRFHDAGYKTASFPYSQSSRSLNEISAGFIDFVRKNVKTVRYHLIGHSLGNVIIREAFKKGYPPGLGRIVMLAPPNRPALLAQKLKGNLLFGWITGDSGQKLSEADFYRDLPVPEVEFGVIAGDKGQRLTFDEPNDGLVAVQTTRLEGMSDFVIVHHTHTFIMNCKDTFEHSLNFLRHGSFH